MLRLWLANLCVHQWFVLLCGFGVLGPSGRFETRLQMFNREVVQFWSRPLGLEAILDA